MARIHFALLATLSVTAGFFPLLMFMGRPFWLIYAFGLSAAISLGYANTLDTKNKRPLTPIESVAVTVATLSEAASIGLFLFMLYGVLWFIGFVIHWLGFRAQFYATVMVTIIAVIGFILLLGVMSATADKLRGWLFPKIGIGNASLTPYVGPGETSPKAIISTIVLLACLALSIFVSSYFYIALQICLMIISTPVMARLDARGPSTDNQTARTAVGAMLEACGYQIVQRLQTHSIELDRLLATFDVVAHRDGYALAIKLKLPTEDEGRPVAVSEAAYLRVAATPMYEAFDDLMIAVHTVLPMMFLIGRVADETTIRFAEQESIRIAKLPPWDKIWAIAVNQVGPEELRELSLTHLGLRPATVS